MLLGIAQSTGACIKFVSSTNPISIISSPNTSSHIPGLLKWLKMILKLSLFPPKKNQAI